MRNKLADIYGVNNVHIFVMILSNLINSNKNIVIRFLISEFQKVTGRHCGARHLSDSSQE